MMRRAHRIVLLLVLLIGSAGMNYVQAEVYSGTCGAAGNEANVTWELNTETGILDINGTGTMTHYWSLPDIPWYNYRQYVTAIFVSPGVTTVGHHAFYDFPNVKRIYLYSSLTSIGVLSFGFCRQVTSLEIPASVTSIGNKALWYNESLKDVYVTWKDDAVPDMPADIHNFEASQIKLHIPCGQEAAYTAKGWNTKFTLQSASDANVIKSSTVSFPWSLSCDSVLTVSGTGAMNDFPNPQYQTIANFRFVMNSPALSPFFSKQKVIKEAVFEEGITYIGNNTLYKGTYHSGYPYLTTLTLPSTLTSMSSTAFTGCIALKDVYVSWTTAVAIPTWNQSIDVSQATLHVPCGTTALYQAKGWQNFIIREERGHGTCGAEGKNLTWLLSCDGTLTISGTGAMRHFWTYETDIPWWNYRGSIQRIVIEEGVTTIGNHAFVQCSNLTSVSLPNTLTAISYLAFGHCISLPSLTIPSSVTSMAGMFIHNTPSLTDVYVSWTGDAVPDMPADIHPQDALQKRLHIPCGQAGAYYAKGWNNRFTLPGVVSGTCGDNVQWTFESCNGTLSIFGTGAMKDFVSSSGAPWYLDRMSITSVTIANGVTTIGNYAFYACVKLSSVAIPSSVTSIGNSGFSSCTKLTSVNIPNSVTNIGIYAFNHCSSLISVTIPNGVTSIGEFTFNGCSSLTSMTIPNSVASIGVSAFRDCSALTDVYASWTGDAIPTMPAGIHTYDASRIRLHIPCGQAGAYFAKGWNTKFILLEGSASGTCGTTGHESDVIWSLCDGTLTIQGTGAMADWSSSDKVPWYSYRSSITTVIIRDGVTSVGNRAFIECTALTSVTIPNSVTSISNNAFFSCSALANITIPNNVTTIGQYVFYGCSALTNITIPGSVTSLGESIFRNCSALTDIYVSWTSPIPDWPTDFTNKSPQSSIRLHVPCSAIELYQAADGWKDYTVEGEGTYIITVESDDPTMGSVDAVKIP